MTDITSKIRKKNDTFPKPLKINKKLIYFTEQIANEFNFFSRNLSPTLAEIISPISTNTQNIWYLSMNLSATLIGKHNLRNPLNHFMMEVPIIQKAVQ